MANAFLDSHWLAHRLFSIGGKLIPVAIRDQMVRGQLMIDRLLREKIIKQKDSLPLLIAGAGAAGVAATIYAVEKHRIPVLLIDREKLPFTIQANCQTRWIDPSLYDFPMDHWAERSYPARSNLAYTPPLSWKAEWSNSLAVQWRVRLTRTQVQYEDLLRYLPSTVLIKKPVSQHNDSYITCKLADSPGDKNIRLEDYSNVRDEDCSAALIAVGPGRERTTVLGCKAKGYGFWSDDPFAKPNLDISQSSPPTTVLISGSGDGALQDFLRITLKCKSPAEAYRAAPLNPDQITRLLSAEHRAHRAFHWGINAEQDHDVLNELHEHYTEVVKEQLRARNYLQLLKLVRPDCPRVKLLFECTHFSNCYSLNHYLTLLVAAILERYQGENYGKEVLLPCRSVIGIRSLEKRHVCNGEADECHDHWHRVEWQHRDGCRELPSGDKDSFDANVLVLRHGVESIVDPFDPTPVSCRHLLPYWLHS